MRLTDDLYVYPWTSYRENNCNTVFIDGQVPTLVDPGHMHLFSNVVSQMGMDGKSPDRVKCVLCTHSHPDHIESIASFDKEVVKGISRQEYEYLYGNGSDLFLATGSRTPRIPFQLFLKEGTLNLGGKSIQVIPTPGHSPGGICLYWKEKKALLSGDTVFYLGVGRTDFEGGDIDALGDSVERLSRLNVEYLIPGHGEMLKGKKAVANNFKAILQEFFGRR